MTQRTAQIIFVILNVLSFFAVAYAVYEFINNISLIDKNADEIPFDSGTWYLLLMSVFWVLSIIQYAGLRNENSRILRYANQAIVYWFLFMLALANLIPVYVKNQLEGAGYVRCPDPAEISRVAAGRSSIYRKKQCD